MTRSIFIGGTGSHAGKSWMATAVCRWLKRRGVRVAPFKAQNMSLNSYPCREGGEIGRAQAVQAEACGLEPSADMNPILLKPNADTASQVVVNGKVWRDLAAREYYAHFPFLLEQALEAFRRLEAEHEVVVMEGAGSVAEINFRDVDLVNLGLARRVGAKALLVADIDRGGVFASVVGTFQVLEREEREVLRAFAINRFRGDAALFDGGVRTLEQRTGRRCLGVFPYLDGVRIDEEDSVALETMPAPAGYGGDVAIVKFPLMSNFTDFQLLPGARWITRPAPRRFRTVILPGSKNTLSDLRWMRLRGLDGWVMEQHEQGAQVVGICGGYQMMGERVADGAREAKGLGLLPARTEMLPVKTTRVVRARTASGHDFRAYEIHMGVTVVEGAHEPFAYVEGAGEGIRHGRCVGTYLHGALEDTVVLGELVGEAAPRAADREASYDRLADWFEHHADTALFEELFL
ncbi:MAG: Cobyric acid synthase [Bryobacteraceae bacterium]|nr:Cobyric acid synthase [Bryobacteraceae bacterium]